jgi:hypothetical protein
MKMSRAPSASDRVCERRQCQRLSLCRSSAVSCTADMCLMRSCVVHAQVCGRIICQASVMSALSHGLVRPVACMNVLELAKKPPALHVVFSHLGQRPGGALPGRVTLTAAWLRVPRCNAVTVIVIAQHSVPGHLLV